MSTTLKGTPLLTEEIASNGFTNFWRITADQLTMATNNTVQDIVLCTVPKGWIISRIMAVLITPLKDASDAAYNTTTLIVGDAGSSNRYLASAQLNENGTEITYPAYGNTEYQVTADTDIVAEFGSQSGKNLNNIDVGEVHIYILLRDTKALSNLAGGRGITTK